MPHTQRNKLGYKKRNSAKQRSKCSNFVVMPKHRHYNLVQVISSLIDRGMCGRDARVDRLPARHRGRPHRIRNALSTLERGNAHHIWVSFGGFVGVLEANAFVSVVPSSDAGEKPAFYWRGLIPGYDALTGHLAQCPFQE